MKARGFDDMDASDSDPALLFGNDNACSIGYGFSSGSVYYHSNAEAPKSNPTFEEGKANINDLEKSLEIYYARSCLLALFQRWRHGL